MRSFMSIAGFGFMIGVFLSEASVKRAGCNHDKYKPLISLLLIPFSELPTLSSYYNTLFLN